MSGDICCTGNVQYYNAFRDEFCCSVWRSSVRIFYRDNHLMLFYMYSCVALCQIFWRTFYHTLYIDAVRYYFLHQFDALSQHPENKVHVYKIMYLKY